MTRRLQARVLSNARHAIYRLPALAQRFAQIRLHLRLGTQRDLFYQVLIDAAHRDGRPDLVAQFLRDVRRIGFDRVEQRSLYAELAKAA